MVLSVNGIVKEVNGTLEQPVRNTELNIEVVLLTLYGLLMVLKSLRLISK
jgi:hypothetical protein